MPPTTMHLPEPEFIDLAETRVATYVYSPKTRENRGDVVFCHGTPWSAGTWAAVARAIDFGWRALLWDMPGYGCSAHPETGLDLPSQMSRFAQLISAWGLRRPYVISHDIGCAVALGAHLMHDVDYSGLFLWDAVTLAPWGSPFFRLVADHPDVFSKLPSDLHSALVREYIAGAVIQPIDGVDMEALSRPWMGRAGQSAFYRQIASLRPEHTRAIEERLGDVRCRTAVGWGANDPWIPVDHATRLHDALPDCSRPVVLDNVGHLAPVEAPSEVVHAVSNWLDESDCTVRRDVDGPRCSTL